MIGPSGLLCQSSSGSVAERVNFLPAFGTRGSMSDDEDEMVDFELEDAMGQVHVNDDISTETRAWATVYGDILSRYTNESA